MNGDSAIGSARTTLSVVGTFEMGVITYATAIRGGSSFCESRTFASGSEADIPRTSFNRRE
jgi:hypothetical protein